MFDVKRTIKAMMGAAGLNLRTLTERFNVVTGQGITLQTMDYKIKKETMKMVEFVVVCDICGFDVRYRDRQTDEVFLAVPVEEQLKQVMKAAGYTQEKLRQEYMRQTMRKLSSSWFNVKISKEAVKVEELRILVYIMGCDLKVFQRGTRNDMIEAEIVAEAKVFPV